MANHSAKFKQLKDHIDAVKAQKSLANKTHETATTTTKIAVGVSNLFGLIGASLHAASVKMPVIGPIFQIVTVVPKSIATLTDPTKSGTEKIISTGLLTIILGLATAILILKSAAIFLTGGITGIITGLEAWRLTNNSREKYATLQSFKQKTQLHELLSHRKTPEGNELNRLLELRAVELQEELTRFNLSANKKAHMQEELDFVKEILVKKNINIAENPASLTRTLQELYKKRSELLVALVANIDESSEIVPEQIHALQNNIFLLDQEIAKITQPYDALEIENLKASDKVASAASAFALNAASVVVSVFTILLAVGTIATAPFVLPVFIALSIMLATLGICQWSMDRMVEYEQQKYVAEMSENQRDSILDEALSVFEHELHTSYASIMPDLGPSVVEGVAPDAQPTPQPSTAEPELEPEPEPEIAPVASRTSAPS